MKVMVVRSINVRPEKVGDFMRYSLEAAEHSQNAAGILSEIFVKQDHAGADFEFRAFTEFDSLAQYEKTFLEGLLLDGTYLDIVERGVDMVTAEPRDELLVNLEPDDYFMNRKDKHVEYKFEEIQSVGSTSRYRREFELRADKGRLREVMKDSFAIMEKFAIENEIRPKLYCTRFTAGRIGGARMYIDCNHSLACDKLFFSLNEKYATSMKGALTDPPSNTLYLRVTEELAAFNGADFDIKSKASDDAFRAEKHRLAVVSS